MVVFAEWCAMYARVISKVGWFVIQHFIILVVGLEVMDGSDPPALTLCVVLY
jgi:hypothetical protein